REDAVVVTDAVAGGCIPQRGERSEEASGQTAEAAIAEPRIFFFGRHVLDLVAERAHGLAHIIEQAVLEGGERIDQAAPEQELHRQIAHAIDASARRTIARRYPALDVLIAHSHRQRAEDAMTRLWLVCYT